MTTTMFNELADGTISLTQLETDALQTILSSGDRGAFHYSYYRMTGVEDALLTAKISTFSESVGGTAYAANFTLNDLYIDLWRNL